MFTSKLQSTVGKGITGATPGTSLTKTALTAKTATMPSHPALSQLARRPYHVVVSQDTQISDKGKLQTPGHIQLQFTDTERAEHPDLPPALGHSPSPVKLRNAHMIITRPDGHTLEVKGKVAKALIAGQDKKTDPNKGARIDMGSPDSAGAERAIQLAQQRIFEEYETSGHEGKNCVHAVIKAINTIEGQDVVPPTHKYTTPGEALQHIATHTGKPIQYAKDDKV